MISTSTPFDTAMAATAAKAAAPRPSNKLSSGLPAGVAATTIAVATATYRTTLAATAPMMPRGIEKSEEGDERPRHHALPARHIRGDHAGEVKFGGCQQAGNRRRNEAGDLNAA